MRFILASLAFAATSACATPQTPTELSRVSDAPKWLFAEQVSALQAQSCGPDAAFEIPQTLSINAAAVPLPSVGVELDMITGMSLVGTWHLTADDPNFGGLSGLAVQKSGSLLAVSDAGAWVWIGVDPQTGDPDGLGAIAYMRGTDGEFLNGKTQADAEGLALRDGLAFVSFERDHRIEAFALESCGAGARAARVADLPDQLIDENIPENKGAEALALTPKGKLRVGFEFRNAQGSPTGTLQPDGNLADVNIMSAPGLYLQTGLDMRDGLTARVLRAYDPIRKTRVILEVGKARADLKAPLPVDNFEGVAIGKSPEGKTRIWLISDDNFSAKQRTLLFAFDLD